MKTRIVIGVSGPGVTGEALVFELDEEKIARPIAIAASEAIAASIKAKGATWNKTGTLAGGIKAVPAGDARHGFNVVGPPGRLTRDSRLVAKLKSEIPAITRPFDEPVVDHAIDVAVGAIITKAKLP